VPVNRRVNDGTPYAARPHTLAYRHACVNHEPAAHDPATGRVTHPRTRNISARAIHHGDPAQTKAHAEFNASWFTTPEIVERVVACGLATADEMAAMSAAWLAWGQPRRVPRRNLVRGPRLGRLGHATRSLSRLLEDLAGPPQRRTARINDPANQHASCTERPTQLLSLAKPRAQSA